jgi:hypothetical protein
MNPVNINELKDTLIKNEDKIILFIGFALVAILSFGMGKLSEAYRPPMPIVFKNAPDCPTILANAVNAPGTVDAAKTEGKIIGNKNSKIYHIPGSASYNKISPENRVYFDTEADAEKAGYRKTKM